MQKRFVEMVELVRNDHASPSFPCVKRNPNEAQFGPNAPNYTLRYNTVPYNDSEFNQSTKTPDFLKRPQSAVPLAYLGHSAGVRSNGKNLANFNQVLTIHLSYMFGKPIYRLENLETRWQIHMFN